MSKQLISREIDYLVEHFRILTESKDEETKFPLAKLKDESFLKEYLCQLTQEFNTDKIFVSASQFMKRIGYVLVVPTLYTMTVHNKNINIKETNSYLIPRRQNEIWMPHLLVDPNYIETCTMSERRKWRDQVVNDLFRLIAQIIANVSSVSNVPNPILWENVAVYIFWLYEKRLQLESTVNDNVISGDFDYIIHHVPVDVFDQSYHPLLRFYQSKHVLSDTGDQLRMRRTCCFYYETNSNGGFCKNCPKSNRNCKEILLEDND
ncbi:(2Fe-2S)-binding protein [Aquibacillus albus]|uniref:Ferric iron reductase protein FhuF n=1 Tax=Aquibacillus albus TaxID=1168171 RepID=A0ABS2MVL0_9BACI|nr:(2Fe-2S)-binding protein [Aquibacillus albus]MBM7569730.1 ferric iron reductase protein FhuF [Aquibacillus albus]